MGHLLMASMLSRRSSLRHSRRGCCDLGRRIAGAMPGPNCLGNASQMGDCLGQTRWPIALEQRPHQLGCTDCTELQRARDPQDVLPVPDEPLHGDSMVGKLVQRAVIGVFIDPPEPSAANVGEPRTELVAEQPEEPKDDIAGPGRISHDLDRLEAGLLFQKPREDVKGIA